MNVVLSSEEERQPLIQNQTPSVRSHNFDDFYSPIDSPQGKQSYMPALFLESFKLIINIFCRLG